MSTRLPITIKRTCGDCTACCTVLGVPSIDKDQRTRCEHDTGTCCSIYATKPKECTDYSCLWVLEMWIGNLGWRPDKLGIIFDTAGSDLPLYEGIATIGTREVWAGAFDEPFGSAALDSLVLAGVVLVLQRVNGRKSIAGPPDKLAIIQGRLRTGPLTAEAVASSIAHRRESRD